jgi:signal transduction histidine kinase
MDASPLNGSGLDAPAEGSPRLSAPRKPHWPRPGRRGSLARYLTDHAARILAAWDAHAASLADRSEPLEPAALRGHGDRVLAALAAALRWDASPPAGSGAWPEPEPGPTAAQLHTEARRLAGFPVESVVAEYRALRRVVLEGWHRGGGPGDTQELQRFDDAIDQAIAESISWYARQTRTSTELFIGILGHDIRNPLGTILACTEYFVQASLLSKAAAAPLLNAAWRIRAIVEQTMDFTRSQSHGAMPVHRAPCRLADQLARVVTETQLRHPSRVLQLVADDPLEGHWDEDRLAQVLSNLLGNAISYGARDAAVTVRAWATPAQACFSVHNWGAPIPPGECSRIFEPLVRGNAAIVERRARSGLGLGLFICREIVRAHGGTVSVASSAADGTTFTVALPRDRAVPQACAG